jgi:hypothetical protein
MKGPTRLVLSIATALVAYFTAYFVSVRVSYALMPAVYVAVPVYRPWHEESIGQWFAQKLFAPAQLLDESFLRPAKWKEKHGREITDANAN